MAINIESISDEIFKILKGNGHRVQLFTGDGMKTTDPESAMRFYSSENKLMINLNIADEKAALEVNVGKNTDIDLIRPMLDTLRDLASRNMIGYTLRTFGTEIYPKDFAHQARKERDMQKVEEGFSKTFGSKKSSYQTLESARLVIRHKKAVDESVRGSRSRNIHSLFIENAEGERFKFPNTNLQAARALTKHVKEGGTPYDNLGEHIISLSEELSQLRQFSSYVTKNSLLGEGTNDVFEGVTARIKGIRESFKTISSARGYAKFVETFKDSTEAISEDDLDGIRQQFTVHSFDENVSGALPHVARIVTELTHKKTMLTALKKLADKVTSGEELVLRSPLDPNDPDNPDNMQFSDGIAELSAYAGYLEKYLLDDELSNMVNQLGADIHELPKEYQEKAAKLLTYVRDHATIRETVSKNTDMVSESINVVIDALAKYDIDRIL